jgi:hypothetical protein
MVHMLLWVNKPHIIMLARYNGYSRAECEWWWGALAALASYPRSTQRTGAQSSPGSALLRYGYKLELAILVLCELFNMNLFWPRGGRN